MKIKNLLSLDSNRIADVATPTSDNDAANKAYVDAAMPTGSIITYGGITAPSGFLLCDGTAVSRTTYSTLRTTVTATRTFTLTNASTSVTTGDTTGLVAGTKVEGTGIPSGATISSITNSTSFVLSSNATTSGAQSLTFFPYGAGDGSTTFNIPDLSGRTAVGAKSADTDFSAVGVTGGASTVTLSSAQCAIPSHSHNLNSSTGAATVTGSNPTFTYARATNTADANGSRARITDISTSSNATTLTTAGGGIKLSGSTETQSQANAANSHTNLQPYTTVQYIIKT